MNRDVSSSEVQTPGSLFRNLVLFGRLLRRLGLEVTPDQVSHWARALDYVEIGRREDFKNAARSLLVSRQQHLELFDRAFDLFWQAPRSMTEMDLGRILRKVQRRRPPFRLQALGADTSSGESGETRDTEPQGLYTYSAAERLREKDFAELEPEERQEVRRLLQTMSWELERRRSRRRVAGSRDRYLDMRRVMRHNLRHGGEPLKLAWRTRKLKRRPLVLLCDISGSMEPYSRILLQFIYVLSNGMQKVEAFLFGTRLTRITRQLLGRDIDEALLHVTREARDWGGGTRIGNCLKTFNYQWARRVLSRGAVALVISDGWDRGEVELLEREMNRLRRSCHRLIWLNPLLGSPSYQPLTRGIQAALPYVDDFLPVHNLRSLEQLGELLENLVERRPFRRQPPLARAM